MIPPHLFDGWAASRDLLQFLYRHIRRTKPHVIVECGSGVSTVVMAEALRRNGSGHLTSLEHGPHYYDRSRRLLIRCGLEERATVHMAPVRNGWYDADTYLPEGHIDLLLVDGPPGAEARYPAFPKLQERTGIVVLDDAHRIGEQQMLYQWLSAYPEWGARIINHQRGTAVLTREAA